MCMEGLLVLGWGGETAARPEGRAGKHGLERRFFAGRLRRLCFVVLWREQDDFAFEVERKRPDLGIDAAALASRLRRCG